MSQPPWSPRHLFDELSRRRVIRVAIVYGIVGAAVMEVGDVIIEGLNLSHGVLQALVVITLLGFPLSLVLAWAYDLTPEGVVRAERPTPTGDPKRDATALQRVRVSRRVGLAFLSVIFVAAVISSWLVLRNPMHAEPGSFVSHAGRYVDSVAVMPLDNLTGDPSLDYLGVAIAEEIISELSQLAPLKVISRHSVEALSASNLRASQLADSLDVQHIVEGSLRMEGQGRLRATVQHVEGSTDAYLWSESFVVDMENLIEAQEHIAEDVIARVKTLIPDLDRAAAVELPPNRQDQYVGSEAFQVGRHWLGQRTFEGINRAIEQFTVALVDAPDHAASAANLASAYTLAVYYRYTVGAGAYESAARALAAANRAIELAPELADGYAARGLLGAIAGAPLEQVAADFDRARELSPNAAAVASWSARVLAADGRHEEALAEAERAVDLDPLSSARYIAIAGLTLSMGRYDRSIEAARMAAALEPDLMMARSLEARGLLLSGQALECANRPHGPHAALLATCLWEAGNRERALELVDSVQAEVAAGTTDTEYFTEVVRLEDLALFYTWIGDADEALHWVERAYDACPAGLETRLFESALMEPLRNDDDFMAAVERLRARRWSRIATDELARIAG